jgi:hypothetical protein
MLELIHPLAALCWHEEEDTVSVAGELVAVPAALLTATVNSAPLSVLAAEGVV